MTKTSKSTYRVGELWTYAGRTAIICGNTIDEKNTIWVMDWDTGDCADAPVDLLEKRQDRMSLPESEILDRFEEWAREGNDYAMWWLAWWHEGTNHPKSVWYYVAALRAAPRHHGWALERIQSDARTPYMCEGVPAPDLTFLNNIMEMSGTGVGRDWAEAVRQAESAFHT